MSLSIGRLAVVRAIRRAAVTLGIFYAGVVVAAGLSSDLQISAITDSPDPVVANGLVTYQVRVDNNDVVASSGDSTLRLTVPGGSSFVSVSGASCVHDAAKQEVLCALGSVAGGGADSRTISMVLRATDPGPRVMTVDAEVQASNDASPANNAQSNSTSVVDGADLSLAASASPDPVINGGFLSYTLTASNAGPNASNAMRITATLAPGTQWISASGNGWLCKAASDVVTCDRDQVHAPGAAIPPVVINVNVRPSGGSATLVATVSSIDGAGSLAVADPDLNNDTVSVSTTVTPAGDVKLNSKQVMSGVPAVAGSVVQFRIRASNDGPSAVNSVVVTDALPAGWSFVSGGGAGWTCSAGTPVTCALATLAPGASSEVDIYAQAPDTATVGAGGRSYTNTASVTSATHDSNLFNNSASVSLNVAPANADLGVSKTKSPTLVSVGDTMSSVIKVSNYGPLAASTGPLAVFRVVELLAPGESFVSASGSGGANNWSCTPVGGQYVQCDIQASLAVGASLPDLVLITRADVAGELINTACTGSSLPAGAALAGLTAAPPQEGDLNPSNDCSSASAQAQLSGVDLSLAKTTTTPTGGDKVLDWDENTVTYELVVTHQGAAGASPATGIRVVDTLPALFKGAGATPTPSVKVETAGTTVTMSCSFDAATGTVSCNQAGGQLESGQSIKVLIAVSRGLQAGNFTNTASVSNTTAPDPVPGNNSASDTVQIKPVVDLELWNAMLLPGTVKGGTEVEYVLSFRNLSRLTADGAKFSMTFDFPPGDAGFVVVGVSTTVPGVSCSELMPGAVLKPGNNSFTCDLFYLNALEARSVTLRVRPLSAAATRAITATASISATTPESNLANNAKDVSLTVEPADLDLLVNLSERSDPVFYAPGATYIDYTASVTNNGPSYATGVLFDSVFQSPPGKAARFVCDTATEGGACSSPSLCSASNVTGTPGGSITVSCSLPAGSALTGLAKGDLKSGASKAVWLRYEEIDTPSPAGDTYSTTVTVQGNEAERTYANNQSTETTTVRRQIDLSVSVAANQPSVSVGDSFEWTVTVSNSGPSDSLNTLLHDVLTSGMELTGAPAASAGSCTVTGASDAPVLDCAFGPLAIGATATVTLPVRLIRRPATNTVANTAALDTNTNVLGATDINASNDVASSLLPVTQERLTGKVYQDVNGNGVPDAGEPGLPGVGLELGGTDMFGAPFSRSATTDAQGEYTFDVVPSNAAGYRLVQTQPAGYVSGINPPAGSGVDTAGGTRPGVGATGYGTTVDGIVLGLGASGANYWFAEILVVNPFDLSVTKVASAATVVVGQVFDWTLTVSNAGPSATDQTKLSDTLPAGMALTSTPVNCTLTGQKVDCTLGALASGATATVTLPVKLTSYPTGGSTANTVVLDTTPATTGGTDMDPANNTATASVNVDRTFDLAVTKTPSIPNVVVGQAFDWTLTVSNAGPAGTLESKLSDTLPAGMALTGAPVASAGSCTVSGQKVDCTLGALASGATATVTLPVKLTSYPTGGSAANTVVLDTTPATTGGTDTNATNDTATASVNVDRTFDLSVTKTPSIPNVVVGQVFDWTLTVGNAGPAGTLETKLSDTLPAGMALTSTPANCTLSGQKVDCTLGALASGATASVVLPVKLTSYPANGTAANTVVLDTTPAATGGTDMDPANDTATASVNVDRTFDLSVTKVASAATVVVGQAFDWTLTVSNAGPAGTLESKLSDTLPAGMALTSTPVNCTLSGQKVDCTLGALASGATASVVLPVKLTSYPAGGSTSNTVVLDTTPATTGGTDTNPGNDTATGTKAVGKSFDLSVTKFAQGVFSTNNLASYRIKVANVGLTPSSGQILVRDRLPAGIVLAETPRGQGWNCSGAANSGAFECTSAQVVSPGAEHPAAIEVPVRVLDNATGGSQRATLYNAVLVSGDEAGGLLPGTAEIDLFENNPLGLPDCGANAILNACRAPTVVLKSSGVGGTVWLDRGAPASILDAGDVRLSGWGVEIVDEAGRVLRQTRTQADGSWRASDLAPETVYQVRFRDPVSHVVWGKPVVNEDQGLRPACLDGSTSESCVESGALHQLRITLPPGRLLLGQSLPVNPGGVVYDSVTREPVAGAVVSLSAQSCAGFDPARHIANAAAGGYTIDGRTISMTAGDHGAYQFNLTPSAPASCEFVIGVRPPATHRFVSRVIPPQPGTLVAPPRLGTLRVQPQTLPPRDAESTAYWLSLRLGAATEDVVHNHIPLDPLASGGIVVSKTASTQIVEMGDSLQYTVRVRNTHASAVSSIVIEDRLPAGFRFIPGTAQLQRGSVRTRLENPQGSPGPVLHFALGALGGNEELTLSYRVRVGVGSQEGDGINRAQAKPHKDFSCGIQPAQCSNLAAYQVKVQGGVFTTATCVAGKVYVDCNGNHVQDGEEIGIPGVRLWLQNGTHFTTDREGKYSHCGLPPQLAVIKVDSRTLPQGSRLATSSNRNAGDANSLFLDLKNGELHRADFIEGSCSNTVLEQVKARRTQGGVSAARTETPRTGVLHFSTKPAPAPTQATDSADQRVPDPGPPISQAVPGSGAMDSPRFIQSPAGQQQGGSDVR